MFSNVGWGEILLIFIVGLVVVGPERLPKVITDVRAMILAARTAINEARDSLNDEFGGDFDDLRKPLQELGELRKLNPRTAITRTLFDGDDTYLDMLSGKPAAGAPEYQTEGVQYPADTGVQANAIRSDGVQLGAAQSPAQQESAAPAPVSGSTSLASPTTPKTVAESSRTGQTWVDPVAAAKAPQEGNKPQPRDAANINWADDDVL